MKKIIVVDDDADMRDLICGVLKPHYQVESAEDGVAGLDLIRRQAPDLVVLDLLMPRMHGFEVCKRIREDESLRNTKVLISSSKSYLHDIKTATGAGADRYIVKPFDIDKFLGAVSELLGGSRNALTVRFWGTRGSIPAPGPLTQRYGGNTPCTELRFGDQRLIIDAGSGLRELGHAMLKDAAGKPISSHLFIGHSHWDHIQGLPFFTPMYLPGNQFKIYGVHGTTQSFADVLAGQMHPTYFPVGLKEAAAKLEFLELEGPASVEGVKVTTHYLNHPGITVGFRFETADWTLCYLSDHEPYGKLNNKGEFSAKEDEAVARFVEGSDLLICEAQYTEEEYKLKKAWGHSSFGDVIRLAAQARAKQVALFHHDPTHTDEMMDRFVADCKEFSARQGHELRCFAAQEGMELTL